MKAAMGKVPGWIYLLVFPFVIYMVANGRSRLMRFLGGGKIVNFFLRALHFNCLGSWLIIISIANLPRLISLMEGKAMRRFGQYSFPIYLIHWPVICSFSILMFESLGGMNGTLRFFAVYFCTAALVLLLCLAYLHTLEKAGAYLTGLILKGYDSLTGARRRNARR